MLIRFYIIIFVLICVKTSFGQSEKKLIEVKHSVSGLLDENETRNELKDRLELQAQLEMIEKHFGKSISQSASTSIENESNGEQSKSKVNFNFQSNSIVRGEWVKYNNGYPKFSFSTKGEKEIWCTAEISGFIREKVQLITFESSLSNCPKKICKTELFSDNDSLYLFFKSSMSGYVYVYYEDDYEEKVFRALPSKKDKNNKVEAGTDYIIFFNKNKNDLEKGMQILNTQPVTLGLAKQRSFNHCNVKVLFSEKKLPLPITNYESSEFIENYDLQDGTKFPESIDKAKFLKFMGNLKVNNEEMQIMDLSLTIEK
jgi:hypothetical protein